MDSDRHLNYSELSDDQLRSAIRFAKERIRWVEEDHVSLLRSYHDEVTAIQRAFVSTARDTCIEAAERASLHRRFQRALSWRASKVISTSSHGLNSPTHISPVRAVVVRANSP